MTTDELADYLAERMGAEILGVNRLSDSEAGESRYWVVLTRGDRVWGETWSECPPGFTAETY